MANRKPKVTPAESTAALDAQSPPEQKSGNLIRAINACILGNYRSLEVEIIDVTGETHIAHIYRCSPELVRADFKVKK